MAEKILSAGLWGLEVQIVEVESDVGGGELGSFLIVGLPDKAISESRERVRSAIKSLGIKFPQRKIITNLAPADFKKQGPGYDLPIAISILSILYNFKEDFSKTIFIGELALNGDLRPVNGILAIVSCLKKYGIKNIYLPSKNAKEAKLIPGIKVFPVKNLKKLFFCLLGRSRFLEEPGVEIDFSQKEGDFDMENIKGQDQAKRALEIAAAGGHNLLMIGPPGSGKTLLARTMTSILPELSLEEALEVSKIYSVAGKLGKNNLIINRPFRAPHHNSSVASILGGGTWPSPGEISLAHRGVLFLDELAEFPRFVLDNLRQPLEDGFINICRISRSLNFPSRFMFLGAMNPCSCGYSGDKDKKCCCSPSQLINYNKKISGPIKDRIDIFIEVPRVSFNKITSSKKEESSKEIRRRVDLARERQNIRFKGLKIFSNSEMNAEMVKDFCKIDFLSKQLLEEATEKLGLSVRSYFRVLKIARTIADLNLREEVSFSDIAEALQYRPFLK